MKQKTLFIVMAAALVAADQAIKSVIRKYAVGAVLLRFPPFLEITYQRNTGAAFSIMGQYPQFLTLLTFALLCIIAWAAMRMMKLTVAGRLFTALLIAGGAGNLIDRILFGYVTDYIRLLFIDFPVFNLADILITSSVFVIILLLISGRLEQQGNLSENKHGSNH